jgi:hypothetical protein
MKIIVAVIVYDRLSHISEWIRVWKQCNKQGAELIIVHNYKTHAQSDECKQMCEEGGVKYVKRINIGMDIGAFQDICKERLNGFPNDWDLLFWVTDDVTPMSKKFLNPFIANLKNPKVGVACLEISHQVKTHIRTTGFMLSKETSKKLIFPAETVTDKLECYKFEHKGADAFYEQIRAMGKHVVQVNPDLSKAPLWDTHLRAHFKRWNQHYFEFPR